MAQASLNLISPPLFRSHRKKRRLLCLHWSRLRYYPLSSGYHCHPPWSRLVQPFISILTPLPTSPWGAVIMPYGCWSPPLRIPFCTVWKPSPPFPTGCATPLHSIWTSAVSSARTATMMMMPLGRITIRCLIPPSWIHEAIRSSVNAPLGTISIPNHAPPV